MRRNIALQRYLQRHIEPGLPEYSFSEASWHDVLVLPAYRESPDLLARLATLPCGRGRTLVILVLNRPDSDTDPLANAPLRSAVEVRTPVRAEHLGIPLLPLNAHTDLYLLDMEALYGPTPTACGVGLARKTGCDLALLWMHAGGISGRWLCSTDADARLPPDYFKQLDNAAPPSAAAVFPFRHVPGDEPACDSATALYELRLHHYVLGLEYAGSPYAYHTLGSCLAVHVEAYAQVRGFPKRAGAEDFYVLNKLAKVGPVARLQGRCIELQSRRSTRVPFGTGPAVNALLLSGRPEQAALFYHPNCFAALGAVLAALPELTVAPQLDMKEVLHRHGLTPELAQQAERALQALGVTPALDHCKRQSKSPAQFLKQFHQWFDAFRTLKFIHAMRDAGWAPQSWRDLAAAELQWWPDDRAAGSSVESSLESVRSHLRWY